MVFALQFRVRRRPPAAALIEQKDVVDIRIEQPAMIRGTPASRSAMQENRRLAPGFAAPLMVNGMAVANGQHPGLVGFDGRVERPKRAHFLHAYPVK